MKKLLVTLVYLGYSFLCQSQIGVIKEVPFSSINGFIAKEIVKFVEIQEAKNELFKSNFGFIFVDNIVNYPRSPFNPLEGNSKPSLSFRIVLGSYYITPNTLHAAHYCENCYPTFYTKYKGRVVLIYDEKYTFIVNNKYSIRSQKKLEKELIPHFQQALDENFEFWNPFEKKRYKISSEERKKKSKKEIYKEASYVYDEAIKVIIYNDGKVRYE